MARILITGAAGFIGYHVSKYLSESRAHEVFGLDNLNSYYDVNLKLGRLKELSPSANFSFDKIDICDQLAVERIFQEFQPEYIVHLAAQAGVRHSLKDPCSYISSNIQGTLNMLECCRRSESVKHFVYASSSSVYGLNRSLPFKTTDPTNHPASLYAATKKSSELMAHSYSHLFGIPCTGLRFFTVYGPWGRPDMALFLFSKSIVEGKPLNLFNYGNMRRDFTYVDDVVQGVTMCLFNTPISGSSSWNALNPCAATSSAPYRVFNIGNHRSEKLLDIVRILEREFGKKALINFTEMEPGDVLDTFADIEDLHRALNFRPKTNIDEGVSRFVEWYKKFYQI